jgi:hypothetical protein
MSAPSPINSTDHRWNWAKSSSGSPRRTGDDPHRELEGELPDELGSPASGEPVDQPVADGIYEVELPPSQSLLPEGAGHEIAVEPVFGIVHPENHVAHHQADGAVVASGTEELGAAEDP